MSETSDGLGTLLPGFAGVELPGWVAERLRSGLAGVTLFGPNIASSEQLRALTAEIRSCNPSALIAVDEEGGDVTRLHYDTGSPLPGNAWLGRLDDEARTRQVGASIADELRAAGCNLNFAPCADVNSDPRNPVIGVRSFGAEPGGVARHTAAWVAGHQSRGVAACVKHYPGHGDTSVDSHHALPVLDVDRERLDARELPPFQAAFDAGAWAVMTSHIMLPRIDPSGPATFSARALGEMLRGEMGFDGVVVSDALDMAGASADIGIPEAAVRALAGGCDLLCLGSQTARETVEAIERAIEEAVQRGRLRRDRLADALDRTARLAELVAVEPGASTVAPDAVVGPAEAAEVFEVAADAARMLSESAGEQAWQVVCLETTPNMAAGVAPWGPAAAQRTGSTWSGGILSLREGEAAGLDARLGDRGAVLVGRSNHRHPWVRAIAAASRERRPTVVVDMGWPEPTRELADIATFGASLLLGEALLVLLRRLFGGAP
jgi:beta-N-acetylhexosaminidase